MKSISIFLLLIYWSIIIACTRGISKENELDLKTLKRTLNK